MERTVAKPSGPVACNRDARRLPPSVIEARPSVNDLAVLINRTAHRFARDHALLEATARASGPDAIVVETMDTAHVAQAARQIAHANPSTIALCGGDGTYMLGLTSLREAYGDRPLPRIALIPGGTVSTVARNFGLSGAPDLAMARVAALHGARTLATVRHRTLLANGRVGFIFGAALVANFFDVYYGTNASGYLDAAAIVGRIFVESFTGGALARRVLDPVQCTLSIDGTQREPKQYSLICCATLRDLGLHMQVCYRAGERDDRLHLVASSLPTRRLGPQMFRVLRGRRLRGAPHFDDLLTDFRVSFPQNGSWVLDGDVMRDHIVDVGLGPLVAIVSTAET